MNKIVNKFMLLGDKVMPEIHLKQPGFTHSAGGLLKTRKELKNLCRQGIHIISTRIILIKLVFNMVWLTVNIKI